MTEFKNNTLAVGLASDRAGYAMKEFIKEKLEALMYRVIDFGTNSNSSCDYADYAKPLAAAIQDGIVQKGFAFCGSGNGISISLNRNTGVRFAYC